MEAVGSVRLSLALEDSVLRLSELLLSAEPFGEDSCVFPLMKSPAVRAHMRGLAAVCAWAAQVARTCLWEKCAIPAVRSSSAAVFKLTSGLTARICRTQTVSALLAVCSPCETNVVPFTCKKNPPLEEKSCAPSWVPRSASFYWQVRDGLSPTSERFHDHTRGENLLFDL